MGGHQEKSGLRHAHAEEFEPVVDVALAGVRTLPRVPEDQVERPFGEEKLVGGVFDLLAGEIPDVEIHLLAIGGVWHGDRHDVDADGFLTFRVAGVGVALESFAESRLA